MSSDSRIGTPERTSAESVREKRASAVLRTSLPKTGTFSLIASHCLRPSSELIQRRNPNAPPTSATKIEVPELAADVRDVDEDLRRRGQRAAELLVDPLEHRDDEQQHRGDDRQHEDRDDQRVGHRRLHLAAQLDLLLDRVGQAQQHAVERTADLTGAHHRDVEAVERLRVLRHRLRERRALLDVHPDLVDDLGERLALGLLGEDVERAQQREAGVDHRRELAREDRDVLQLDAVGRSPGIFSSRWSVVPPCCWISMGT